MDFTLLSGSVIFLVEKWVASIRMIIFFKEVHQATIPVSDSVKKVKRMTEITCGSKVHM